MLLDLNRFDRWLKTQRTNKGISQARLGKKIGASQDVISLYETGKSSPNFSTLVNLLNGLGYSAVIEVHSLQDEKYMSAELCEDCINSLNDDCVLSECPYYARQRIEK